MGYWSLYFIAKLVLYATGHLDLHVALNLALALLVSLPHANARQHLAKNLLAVPLGIMLLYHDSWFPPLPRVLESLPVLSGFSMPYLAELTLRLVDLRTVLALGVCSALYLLLRRKLRLGTFAVVGLLAVAVLPAPGAVTVPQADPRAAQGVPAAPAAARALSPAALDALLSSFRSREAKRRVELPPAAGVPYDIVLLHICSLAWDDLQAVGMQDDPFLKRFDILFTRFNSAASYSGPAAIRLLRASCGQSAHRDLYGAAPQDCYLLAGLENAGFEPHWLMNHDGHFGDFFADVRLRGGVDVAPEVMAAATVGQYAFDGTPVYGDYSVLSAWWARRLKSAVERNVVYYNTISLHDGNRIKGSPPLSTAESYRARARLLFGDLGRFMDAIAAAHRRVVVVLIPEHGAALRGERRQLQGLREVPSGAITQVPVGVAFIDGSSSGSGDRQHVDAPVSYLALAQLLANVLADNPFGDDAPPRRSALRQGLPETMPVSENENTVIVDAAGAQHMRTPDGAWSDWDPGRQSLAVRP